MADITSSWCPIHRGHRGVVEQPEAARHHGQNMRDHFGDARSLRGTRLLDHGGRRGQDGASDGPAADAWRGPEQKIGPKGGIEQESGPRRRLQRQRIRWCRRTSAPGSCPRRHAHATSGCRPHRLRRSTTPIPRWHAAMTHQTFRFTGRYYVGPAGIRENAAQILSSSSMQERPPRRSPGVVLDALEAHGRRGALHAGQPAQFPRAADHRDVQRRWSSPEAGNRPRRPSYSTR